MSRFTPPSQVTNIVDYYRQECVHNQKHLYKFTKHSSPIAASSSNATASSSVPLSITANNNKLIHLKLIHKKWFNNTVTTVTSHRRGIEYQTKYQHLDCDSYNGSPLRYVFCKKYLNPSYIPLDRYQKKTQRK
ncbi:hypothetical protein RCL_jg19540.t1 [Rhizophagus clarus]|uniref:DUF8211 domain-containing protein n=1 Tax=Rhizophagus clarus TaxID=94130 RepID=A0A8H3QK55_9GLOM|nr:hypothetical protein RCL_jg19540.t1 [Rhizophagus clarus]